MEGCFVTGLTKPNTEREDDDDDDDDDKSSTFNNTHNTLKKVLKGKVQKRILIKNI
jgi:hypothetical protein